MRFSQDRNQKFLFRGIGIILAAALILGGFLHIRQLNQVKLLLLEQQYAAADRMLEIGMGRADIAYCLEKGSADSGAGRALLYELGYTPQVGARFLPALSRYGRSEAAARAIVFLTFASGLCAVLIFCQRRFSGSMRLAERRVRAFMEGDFTQKLPAGDQGEMSHLFSAVNQMAAALYDKGKAQERAKVFLQDMIADISHQFKTPIAALSMNTQIMEEDANHPEIVKSFAGKNRQSLERLDNLIRNFLKVAKLDAGMIVFEKKTVFAAELLQAAAGELYERAVREKKTLTLTGDPKVTAVCDPGWTVEAVSNLIKNALDHTGEGGRITAGVMQTALFVTFYVEDDGSGIHEEDLYYIFRRFYRSRFSQDTQGTGLGLSLVKAVAEGQGGEVSVRSVLGEGSRFMLSYKNVT